MVTGVIASILNSLHGKRVILKLPIFVCGVVMSSILTTFFFFAEKLKSFFHFLPNLTEAISQRGFDLQVVPSARLRQPLIFYFYTKSH